MINCIENFLKTIEGFFTGYPFFQDFIIAFIGVIFGGVVTVIINNGAMRKQCRFDMQYKILDEEFKNISEIYKKIEMLEIGLSFGDGKTEPYQKEIDEVQHLLLKLNDRLRQKRKFVRKYMSATIVEKSAQCVTDYVKILYTRGDNGFFDFHIIENVDCDKIEQLRNFENYVRDLTNDMADAMESIVSPGWIAKFSRVLRKPCMIIEDCNAIRKVHKHK